MKFWLKSNEPWPSSPGVLARRAVRVLTLLGVLVWAPQALAQRVLLVRPPATDPTLSEAFVRLRAELKLQDFEVVELDAAPGATSPETLETEARRASAFAGILLTRRAGSTSAEVCIADRVTGKTTQRTLAITDPQQAPRVLAVRAVDLLRSSLRELPPGERPPPDVVGVQAEPIAPEVRAWSAPPSRFRLEAAVVLLAAGPELGPAFGPAIALFYRPGPRFRAGVVLAGPLLGARYEAPAGAASIRQALALVSGSFNLLPEGAVTLGPLLFGGVYHLKAQGEVEPPLRGLRDSVFSFAAGGGVGAELALSSVLVLSGSFAASFVTPRPVVAVELSEHALPEPLLLASLGLGVGF